MPPVVIFLVIVLHLGPALAPTFALDNGSDRTISSDNVFFTAKAESEEESWKPSGQQNQSPPITPPPITPCPRNYTRALAGMIDTPITPHATN